VFALYYFQRDSLKQFTRHCEYSITRRLSWYLLLGSVLASPAAEFLMKKWFIAIPLGIAALLVL